MSLKGKVAVVTGGSSGIGKAIAIALATDGAFVIIASRDVRKGRSALKEIPNGVFIQTDVRKELQLTHLIRTVIGKYKRIDILVNNAGVYYLDEEDILKLKTVDFNDIMDTNFSAVFHLTKLCLPYLKKSKGTIVNIASTNGLRPGEDVPVYSASKAAVVMFTKAMALNYAKSGVRINCVCPGPIDTPMLRSAFRDENEFVAYYRKHNPSKRPGKPEDVARVVSFLVSENPFISGAVYTVDGGGVHR